MFPCKRYWCTPPPHCPFLSLHPCPIDSTPADGYGDFGGAVKLISGVLSLEDCIVDGNTLGGVSYPEGAAFYVGGTAFLTVISTQIINNIGGTGSAGGALAYKWCSEPCASAAQVVLTGCTIKGNRAKWGGAVCTSLPRAIAFYDSWVHVSRLFGFSFAEAYSFESHCE